MIQASGKVPQPRDKNARWPRRILIDHLYFAPSCEPAAPRLMRDRDRNVEPEPSTNEPSPNFAGMTVNERLSAAGLLQAFEAAARLRDRDRMVGILHLVQVGTPEWSVDTILADPKKYGL